MSLFHLWPWPRSLGPVPLFEGGTSYSSAVARSGCSSVSAVFLLLSINVSLEMAAVPKGRKIVNDTTPMMCTIEGIAKKEHVVRNKLVFFVCIVGTAANVLFYVSRSVIMSQDYIMKVQRGINHDDSWQVSSAA